MPKRRGKTKIFSIRQRITKGYQTGMEIAWLQIRTVAAIMVWFVVVLLFLNRFVKSEWITPIAIVLTGIAVVVYFSPRLRKGTKSNTQETENVTA